ncbi:MAG: 16S rRNA (cytosine(967)-C(5))-methyltransferase RsmB [Clostridia bacterium]|nr:16S rRNA (cytosine(967)-C(5))-methyltransferase RsmB [Clostridia bacterium]
MTVRELTLSLLTEYEASGKYVNLSLSSHMADKLTGEERAFLTALLYTTVERKITYDYYIGAISGRSLDKIDPTTLNILRLGMCQIVHIDSVPDHAAVNETVALARNPGEKSFVNGVLRQAARLKAEDKLPLPPREKKVSRYLSVAYSFPLWLVKHFISLYGEEETEKLLDRFNTARYTDLTVNLTKTTKEEHTALLKGEGYEPESFIDSPLTVRLPGSVNPRRLPGFDEGLFFVQDAACAISAEALEVRAGNRVIDVCACPGGKSFAAAILSRTGEVCAFDIHQSKLSLVEDGAKRLGLTNIRVDERDAKEPSKELFGTFDRVICDVPCSGLGVLAKKPDIRHKDNESLQNLPELQYEILEASSRYLKDGGILVYSTCTLNPEENERVVERFLEGHKDFSFADFSVGDIRSQGGMLTLLPHIHGTDGFFIAKIRKEKK